MRTRTTDRDWPIFEIGPVLESYGGDPVRDDMGWYPYRCPFHGDRSASASVNTIIHVFVCHGCEMKGNAVQLIMKEENIPYGDALRRAKEVSGASHAPVSESPGRGRGVSSRSGRKSGSRALRRTWRSS